MALPRIFNSSKFQAAAVASVLAILPFVFDLIRRAPLDTIQADTTKFIEAVGLAWGLAIAGTSLEDAADKHKPGTPGVQVNTGTDAINGQTVSVPTTPSPEAIATALQAGHADAPAGISDVPHAYKLPIPLPPK